VVFPNKWSGFPRTGKCGVIYLIRYPQKQGDDLMGGTCLELHLQ
jgi:hypothetical protein